MQGCYQAQLIWPRPRPPSRDFLPRGSGIVTRRPLILQLVTAKAGEGKRGRGSVFSCLGYTRECVPFDSVL